MGSISKYYIFDGCWWTSISSISIICNNFLVLFCSNWFYVFQVVKICFFFKVFFWRPSEAATGGVLQEKVFLEISQNSQENTCARVSFFCNFVKKETVAQVFSCEFCEISKNTFFTEHLWATASGPSHRELGTLGKFLV